MIMDSEITNETCLNVASIKYTWKIRNFSICNKGVNEYIQSPLFHAEDLPVYKWYLQLYPRGTSSSAANFVSISVYLSKDSKSDIYARSNLQLLNHKMESSAATPDVISHFHKGAGYEFNNFVSRKYLTDYRSMLLPNDTLTIVCSIRINLESYSHEQTKGLENKLAACKLKVLTDLENLLENKTLSDIMIIVSDKNFHAHKAILAARSPVFEEIFKGMSPVDENIIRISDATSESIGRLLKFMYSGKISNIKSGTEDLIYVADKYGINDLKALCEDELCRQLKASNAVHLLKLANKYRTPLLRQKAISIMVGQLKRNNKNDFNFNSLSESKIPYLISAFTSLQKLMNR